VKTYLVHDGLLVVTLIWSGKVVMLGSLVQKG